MADGGSGGNLKYILAACTVIGTVIAVLTYAHSSGGSGGSGGSSSASVDNLYVGPCALSSWVVSAIGHGFDGGEEVQMTVDSTLADTETADSNGTAPLTSTLRGSWTIGSHTLTVKGLQSQRAASATITLPSC